MGEGVGETVTLKDFTIHKKYGYYRGLGERVDVGDSVTDILQNSQITQILDNYVIEMGTFFYCLIFQNTNTICDS